MSSKIILFSYFSLSHISPMSIIPFSSMENYSSTPIPERVLLMFCFSFLKILTEDNKILCMCSSLPSLILISAILITDIVERWYGILFLQVNFRKSILELVGWKTEDQPLKHILSLCLNPSSLTASESEKTKGYRE